jgi:hypothetical protein
MPECMVAIEHITYDAVRAADEVAAIALVREGQGLEMSAETRDASISAYQLETLDHTPALRADRRAHSDARRHLR